MFFNFDLKRKSKAMQQRFMTLICGLTATALASVANIAMAVTITGGSATITIQEGTANGISAFNAYFNESATRAQTLADAAPGNQPFTRPTASTVLLTDPVRPGGVVPVPFPGTPGSTRSPQKTTLDINPSNVLGTWSTSNDAFAFVGNSTLGEQIALTSMTRWTGPFTGSLVYGDFALRYTGTKLVLASNIDFLNAAFADIGSPIISVVGNTLTITGDLLIGGGLNVLDPSAVPGTDFGDFALTATLVPEPSSMLLGALGGLGAVVLGWRRRSGRSTRN
jgi:hypothetical protein